MKNFIKFTKMHGQGNDFVMLDRISQNFNLTSYSVKKIAHRKFGVGCDQIIITEAPLSGDTDFFCRIFNSDGSEAKQCGNGLRCFIHFVRDCGLTTKKKIIVDTISGRYTIHAKDAYSSSVNMGTANFAPESIPTNLTESSNAEYKINIEDSELTVYLVSMGNPHCIIFDKQGVSVDNILEKLKDISLFPEGLNVSFVKVLSEHSISMETFERGAGATLACGSAVSAAASICLLTKKTKSSISVEVPGGKLKVKVNDPINFAKIILSGTVSRAFGGQFALNKNTFNKKRARKFPRNDKQNT